MNCCMSLQRLLHPSAHMRIRYLQGYNAGRNRNPGCSTDCRGNLLVQSVHSSSSQHRLRPSNHFEESVLHRPWVGGQSHTNSQQIDLSTLHRRRSQHCRKTRKHNHCCWNTVHLRPQSQLRRYLDTDPLAVGMSCPMNRHRCRPSRPVRLHMRLQI